MKRFLLTCLFVSFVNLLVIHADEGMWLLPFLKELNYSKMKDKGLELSPEDIYNINESCLKDAVVFFGHGCTGNIISSDGLLITNHHCGFEYVQSHSNLDNDYINDGFWAMSKKEELSNPDLTVTFLISIDDVTEELIKAISPELSEYTRDSIIQRRIEKMEIETSKNTSYETRVYSFFDNNKYLLFKYEVYNDVRLVGSPPLSIGDFGDVTDNWKWPRHTGDFSLFRVYTAPDGSPADYSPENIPMKSRFHFDISLDGFNKGDYTMIIGYPGSTERYISSWGVQELNDIINPNRIKVRGARLQILKKEMDANHEIEIKYASKYSRSANYWKYSIGQNQGFQKLDVVQKKKAEEKRFKEWIKLSADRNEKYKNVLSDIEDYYELRKEPVNNLQLLNEVFLRGIDAVNFARNAEEIYISLLSKNGLEDVKEQFARDAEVFYKDYDLETDKKVARTLIEIYYNSVNHSSQLPGFFKKLEGKYKNNYDKYIDYIYSKSVFTNEERFFDFLSDIDMKKLLSDPVYIIARSVEDKREEERKKIYSNDEDYLRARRLYMEAIMEMNSKKVFYPDANLTMRLTYGEVSDYSPADAVNYRYYTTMAGIIEKDNPNVKEFSVSEKLKEIYKQKDFGNYGEKDYMPVCFTTNNDITGGNSGSAVLNSKGELIGLAFDGNWEAMSGDIVFEPELQRTICVDIRYVLLIIDRFAGAGYLIEEMTIKN